MVNKPDKYGLKLFLLCDCLAGYTLNGMRYIGLQGNQRNVGLSFKIVKFLSTLLHFSGVNVTTDNWFTSSQIATDLLQIQITLLVTMRKTSENFPLNL